MICRKDTAKLIERTILPRLTNGLEVVKLIPLCISVNTDDDKLVCEYNRTPSIGSTTPIVNVYVTGNLAFQAMALGKESMAGHWCMTGFHPVWSKIYQKKKPFGINTTGL